MSAKRAPKPPPNPSSTTAKVAVAVGDKKTTVKWTHKKVPGYRIVFGAPELGLLYCMDEILATDDGGGERIMWQCKVNPKEEFDSGYVRLFEYGKGIVSIKKIVEKFNLLFESRKWKITEKVKNRVLSWLKIIENEDVKDLKSVVTEIEDPYKELQGVKDAQIKIMIKNFKLEKARTILLGFSKARLHTNQGKLQRQREKLIDMTNNYEDGCRSDPVQVSKGKQITGRGAASSHTELVLKRTLDIEKSRAETNKNLMKTLTANETKRFEIIEKQVDAFETVYKDTAANSLQTMKMQEEKLKLLKDFYQEEKKERKRLRESIGTLNDTMLELIRQMKKAKK